MRCDACADARVEVPRIAFSGRHLEREGDHAPERIRQGVRLIHGITYHYHAHQRLTGTYDRLSASSPSMWSTVDSSGPCRRRQWASVE